MAGCWTTRRRTSARRRAGPSPTSRPAHPSRSAIDLSLLSSPLPLCPTLRHYANVSLRCFLVIFTHPLLFLLQPLNRCIHSLSLFRPALTILDALCLSVPLSVSLCLSCCLSPPTADPLLAVLRLSVRLADPVRCGGRRVPQGTDWCYCIHSHSLTHSNSNPLTLSLSLSPSQLIQLLQSSEFDIQKEVGPAMQRDAATCVLSRAR